MIVRNLKILMISFCVILLFSCSYTEVVWKDLRKEKVNFEFKINNIKLDANKTKKISSFDNLIYEGLETPSEYRVAFFYSSKNNKIEIFLMDAPYIQDLKFNNVVEKNDFTELYDFRFYDSKNDRTYYLFSKDNIFDIDLDTIKLNENTSIKEYMRNLHKCDNGFYENGCSFGEYDKKIWFGYYIKSSISDDVLYISPFLNGELCAWSSYKQFDSLKK